MDKRVKLNGMTVSELRAIAKGLNITGRWDMNKGQLIDALMEIHENPVNEVPEELVKKIEAMPEETKRPKADYVNNIEVGTIVAFTVGDKTISGMVDQINTDGASFTIKTKNGVSFKVWRNNIIWVKTGMRWPKGVYLALRGEGLNEHKTAN